MPLLIDGFGILFSMFVVSSVAFKTSSDDMNEIVKALDNVASNLSVKENNAIGFSVPLVKNIKTANCKIMPKNPIFTLLSEKGTLSLSILKVLDREDTMEHKFKVICGNDDRGTYFSTEFTLKVEDVNDNSPTFHVEKYFASVSEMSKANEPIILVQATDADIGDNGEVEYSLKDTPMLNKQPIFKVDKVTGRLYLNQELPAGKFNEFVLMVEAKDRGSPSRKGIAKIVIFVKSENKQNEKRQAPSAANEISLELSEDIERGSKVDQLVFNNNKTKCMIKDDYFALNLTNPEKSIFSVITKRDFDREWKQFYKFEVQCLNTTTENSQVVYKYNVKIGDVNDNAPRFTLNSKTFEITDGTKVGSVVGKVLAEDKDERQNAEISYKLLDDGGGFFDINKSTGEIRLLKELLKNEVAEFLFKVKATDGGKPPLSTETHVMVKVKPDSGSTIVSIEETDDNIDNVVSVPVPKEMDQKKEDLTFKITKQCAFGAVKKNNALAICEGDFKTWPEMRKVCDGKLPFEISQKGVISSVMKLDRELYPMFELTVKIGLKSDPKKFNDRVVTILIKDVNDLKPTFMKDRWSFFTLKSVTPNTTLGYVTAVDPDCSRNGMIRYELLDVAGFNQNKKIFDLDMDTGAFIVRQPLDDLYTFSKRINSKSIPFKAIASNEYASKKLSNAVSIDVIIRDPRDASKEDGFFWRTYSSIVLWITASGLVVGIIGAVAAKAFKKTDKNK